MDKKNKLETLGARFEPINACVFRMHLPKVKYDIVKEVNSIESSEIKSIIYQNVTLEKGETISLKIGDFDINYKANVMMIDKRDNRIINVFESIYNNATTFALPLLFDSRELASYVEFKDGYYTGYLVNTFIACSFISKRDNNSIYLLLKFSKSDRYKSQENYFIKHKNFIKNIDINHNYVIYEFSIPQKFRRDYKLLLEGKYSKLSNDAKKQIREFHNGSKEAELARKVLQRDKEAVKKLEDSLGMNLRGMEIHSIFGLKEILRRSVL